MRRSQENIELKYKKGVPKRKKGTVVRIVRDTQVAQGIKKIYQFECQVCGTAIKTKKGLYAEGAHIKPLGKPHNGDDSADNIMCLCPNHHVMYDKGTFAIDDDFNILGEISGSLRVNDEHKINLDNFRYHREIHGFN